MPMPMPSGTEKRRLGEKLRGIAGFLPGTLTVGNMLAGYAAVLMATQDRFYLSCMLILAAGVLDGVDGRVARMTQTTSDFGEQLDSLADTVSFAVAPSMLAFHMGLGGLGRVGWAVCFLFAACGVIRLARFNALPPRDPRFFIGLPTPAAAASIVTPVLFLRNDSYPDGALPYVAAAMVAVALLMISPIRYRTFKDLAFGRRAYRLLALYAAVLAGLIAAHEWVVPGLVAVYLVLPAAEWLFRTGVSPIAHEVDEEEEVTLENWD